jgi:hypothetical protein
MCFAICFNVKPAPHGNILLCSLQAIRTGWVHPNLNLENPEDTVVSSLACVVCVASILVVFCPARSCKSRLDSFFFLLNIMMRNSPVCSGKNKSSFYFY